MLTVPPKCLPYEDCSECGIAIEHEIIAKPATTGSKEPMPEMPHQEAE